MAKKVFADEKQGKTTATCFFFTLKVFERELKM